MSERLASGGRRLMRVLLALCSVLGGLCGAATTAFASPTYVYDGSAITRVDVHQIVAVEAAEAQVGDVRDESVPPSAEARGTSTTFSRSFIATNTVERQTMFHYTDEAGQAGILDSGQLNPSLKSVNPADARYGNGQYLSDIQPGTMSCAQLSRCFLGQPFQGNRFTNYVEIDVTGLNIVKGRPGVFVNPSETPLDLTGRIVSSGRN